MGSWMTRLQRFGVFFVTSKLETRGNKKEENKTMILLSRDDIWGKILLYLYIWIYIDRKRNGKYIDICILYA